MTTEPIQDACDREVGFPRCPSNRPGLPRIERRIGAYGDIRAFFLERLNAEPLLARWTHRQPDDPGIALLEGAAILGDILTFYQEMYANEAYLRTATWRESIAGLVRLLGYRLSPGIGGRGVFAVEVLGTAPVTVPDEFPLTAQVSAIEPPADFQTSDEIVAYPWLNRFSLTRPLTTPTIQSSTLEFSLGIPPAGLELRAGDRLIVGSGGTSSDWDRAETAVIESVRERLGETLITIRGALRQTPPAGELIAYRVRRSFRHFGHSSPPKWVDADSEGNAVTHDVSFDRRLDAANYAGDQPTLLETEMSLDSSVDDLTPGTTLICQVTPPPFGGGRYVEDIPRLVVPASSPTGPTFIPVAGGAGALGSSMSNIGGSAPAGQPVSMMFAMTASGASAAGSPTKMALVARYEDSRNLLHYRLGDTERTVVRVVESVRQATLTWGAVTGPSSVAGVSAGFGARFRETADIRNIQFHEASSPALRLRAAAVPTPATRGVELGFLGTAAEAATLPGRRLLLVPPTGSPRIATVQGLGGSSGTPAERPGLRTIRLDAEVAYDDYGPEGSPIVVHGNVVDATQGKREREEAVGTGDARAIFQTMPVPKAPLTYLTTPGETPPETPELEVLVNGRRWRRVASLFGLGSADEVYIVREDDEGKSWIQFGDGKTGSRLPSGVDNVVARYRTGIGAHGALVPDTKVQAGARLDRLDAFGLPGEITGGDQPEPGDVARTAAPGKVQSLDRLVSLRDFETEALAIPGVSRATAAWRLVDNLPAAVITILMDTGRETEIEQVRGIVAQSDRRRGASRFPVIVRPGRRRWFAIAATVAIDDTVREADVIDAIQRTLRVAGVADDVDGTASRSFGEREYATRIEGWLQGVTGVRWAQVSDIRFVTPVAPFIGSRLGAAAFGRFERLPIPDRIGSPATLSPPAQPVALQAFELPTLVRPALLARFGRRVPVRVLRPGPDDVLALRGADLAITVDSGSGANGPDR